ncbi:unnamed protein product, partial [Ilex paraguariensis]
CVLQIPSQTPVAEPNQNPLDQNNINSFGVTSRADESIAAANPSFTDGVATKDIHIDPLTCLSLRIFLPDTCFVSSDSDSKSQSRARVRAVSKNSNTEIGSDPNLNLNLNRSPARRNSYGSSNDNDVFTRNENQRRNSYGFVGDDSSLKPSESAGYRGYAPMNNNCRKLPVLLQFHGGGFVSGSNDSVANDFFCRRIAKLCDVIVLSVGYRLAPENRYPAAFEDGLKVLHWLAKQANLAECSKSLGSTRVVARI